MWVRIDSKQHIVDHSGPFGRPARSMPAVKPAVARFRWSDCIEASILVVLKRGNLANGSKASTATMLFGFTMPALLPRKKGLGDSSVVHTL
jgi:hypothetical protein